MFTLAGRTIVMTGANIEVAKALLQEGMNVAMLSHNMARVEKEIAELGELGKNCMAVLCEADQAESAAEALKTVYDRFGSVDVVFPDHGGTPPREDFENIRPENLERDLKNIVVGGFNLAQQALPYLEKSRAGRIIFSSNVDARMGGFDDGLTGSVARGAILSLTYGLAKRLGPKGITVNCIAKSAIDMGFPFKREKAPDPQEVLPRIPVGRVGNVRDLINAIAFLAGEESGYINGQVLHVAGGLYVG